MSSVLDDRRFRIGIGFGLLVAVCVLTTKWALTGSLKEDVAVLQGTAEYREVAGPEGTTMAVAPPKSGAIINLVVDGLMGACFWAGTALVYAGRFAFGFAKTAGSEVVTNLKQPSPQPVTQADTAVSSVSSTDQREQDLYDLARAAALNDLSKVEDLRIKFRWPRALDELTAALQDVSSFSATLKQLGDSDQSLPMIREKLTEAWSRADAITVELKQLADPPATETKPTRGGKK